MSIFSKSKKEVPIQSFKYLDRLKNSFGRIGTVVDGGFYRLMPVSDITWNYKIKWDDGEIEIYSDSGNFEKI